VVHRDVRTDPRDAMERSTLLLAASALLLATHPPDEKRIQDLQALMPQVVPIYEQNRGRF